MSHYSLRPRKAVNHSQKSTGTIAPTVPEVPLTPVARPVASKSQAAGLNIQVDNRDANELELVVRTGGDKVFSGDVSISTLFFVY
jgi:hypothetical protein